MDIFGECTTKNCGQPAVPESWGAYKCGTCWNFITAEQRAHEADEAAAKKRADKEAADIRAKQAATAAAVAEYNRIHAPSWNPHEPVNWRLKKARERQCEKKLKKIRDEMERNPLIEIKNKIESVQRDIKMQKDLYKQKRYYWNLAEIKQADAKLATAEKAEKELKLILAREEEALAKAALAKAAHAKAALAKASLAKASSKTTASAVVLLDADDLDDISECFFLADHNV